MYKHFKIKMNAPWPASIDLVQCPYKGLNRRRKLWPQFRCSRRQISAGGVLTVFVIENDRPAVLVACVSLETDHVDQDDHMT